MPVEKSGCDNEPVCQSWTKITPPALCMFSHFRPRYRGTLIANVGMTRERGNHLITDGLSDLVAFGEPFIANPDLPARFAELAPIQRSERDLHYTPGPRGYTDYPPYEHVS
ncbi:MAG TPA: hypothetical protein VE908_07835 [Mycobacterium sp.]|nr:hypothetical protein [Mycobacterium sp.]